MNTMALHTDKYQINMMYAHWRNGTYNQESVFEAYFRKLPFDGGYAVFAGLERIVKYIEQLRFSEDDIAYLREQEENYDPAFFDELRKFRFSGDLYAIPEGTVVFPNEPLLQVKARIFEAQLLETALLNFMNFQTLVATKAARIKQTSPQDVFVEFGSRRAQEADAAIWGTRAAYIAGFDATSNMLAGKMFGIPSKGTHAHSWVQAHESEEQAFMKYAEALPDHVTLLVDTYDTLKSGVPNAIKMGKLLASKGKKLHAIRLDSGDIAYLSIQARRMLDEAGLNDVKIMASNDLDEYTIFNLKAQGAKIDSWGVGTRLITAEDQPALGGIYKLVEKETNGKLEPTIKISGNPEKITTPGMKRAYRLIDRKTGKAASDYMTLHEEPVPDGAGRIKLYHPTYPFMRKYIEDCSVTPLLTTIYKNGELAYALPTLDEIRAHHQEQLKLFWPEYLRLLNPELYPVNLSEKAYDLKMELIHRHGFNMTKE